MKKSKFYDYFIVFDYFCIENSNIFVIQKGMEVVPVEVKKGKKVKAISMNDFKKKYDCSIGYRISSNYTQEEALEIIDFAAESRKRVKDQLYVVDETFKAEPAIFEYTKVSDGTKVQVETLERVGLFSMPSISEPVEEPTTILMLSINHKIM